MSDSESGYSSEDLEEHEHVQQPQPDAYSEEEEEDLPLWARKGPPPPLRIQIGNYIVCYRDELIAPPPPKFDSMRHEFKMMNLRQRVVDWRQEELRRMLGYLEKKQKAREDEMDSLDDNAEADVSGKKFVNTTILHSKYTKTYKATPIWDEKKWLIKHGKPSSFPQMLDLEQTRMLVVERVNLLRLETRAIREEITALGKRAGGDAVTHLQRLVRGHLGRIYAVEIRKRLAEAKVQSAALQIQRIFRGSQARKSTADVFEQLENDRRDYAAPPIQAAWRGYQARQLYRELEAGMRARQKQNMAIRIQAWYRGCAGRKVAEIVSQSRTQLHIEEDYLDSTVQIQRLLRGHLGRKKMRARKIEVQLNKRVKKLAYDYIGKGSFWEFLGAVNKDYERYNEQRVREEELAATFIHQVLEKREQQQKEAWQSWNIAKLAAEKRGNAALERKRSKAAGVYLANENEEEADKWVKSTMKSLNRQNGTKSSGARNRQRKTRIKGGGGGMMSMMSGLVSGGSALANQGRGLLNNNYGSASMSGGTSAMSALQLPNEKNESSSVLNQNRSSVATPGGSFLSEEPSAIVIGGVSVPPDFGVGQTSRSKPFRLDAGGNTDSYPGAGRLSSAAQEYAPLTSDIVEESSITNANPEFFNGGTQGDNSSVNPFEFDRFPTDELTIEITSKEEPVDRLLLHAALRTFIPINSNAVTGEDAFREFLRMPRGLLKVQRESEVARFAQPYVKILKYAGMRTVESLKLATATQLTALGLPNALAEVLCRLVRKLYRSWHRIKPGHIQESISGIIEDQESQFQRASSPLGTNRSSHRSSLRSRGGPSSREGVRTRYSGSSVQNNEAVFRQNVVPMQDQNNQSPYVLRRGSDASHKNSNLPGDAPNIPNLYAAELNTKTANNSKQANEAYRLGEAWPYDKNFDLRPSSSNGKGHAQGNTSGTGYENAMLLAGYPVRDNYSRGSTGSTVGGSRPNTSATINYGSDSRPGTALSLRDQLLSRGSTRGSMNRSDIGSRGERAVTPGLGVRRPGTSQQHGRERSRSRDAGIGKPPTTPNSFDVRRKSSVMRSLSMPIIDAVVDPPDPVRHQQNQGRPGTTGNLHVSTSDEFGPTSPTRTGDDASAVISSNRDTLVSPQMLVQQRPATVDGSSLPPIAKSPQRRPTFQLPPSHNLDNTRVGTGRKLKSRDGSRPNTRGTLNSRGSNRPSTTATVDYGFAHVLHSTSQEESFQDNMLPFEGNQDNDEATPRFRPPSSQTVENPEETIRPEDQDRYSDEKHSQSTRPGTASELRRRLLAPLVIRDIDESLENLIVGAAMQTYVGSDSDYDSMDKAGKTANSDSKEAKKEITPENAFDNFIKLLISFPKGPTGERSRRELVRQRTRAMLKWVKPYLVTLRKQNLLTVRSIVEMGRPIEALALPLPIQEKLREVIGGMLPHSTASIGFDKRFQRSKLDAAGRPPPPADILNFPDHSSGKKGGVTPADDFYASHTMYPNYADEFRDRPTRKRWPGSRIQVYPIPALESDYGRPLPTPTVRSKAPRSSVAERQRYKCRYPDCKCAFSRQYTLQLHERTHLYASDHYFWKHSKKIGEGIMNQDFAKAGVKFSQNGSLEMSGSGGLSAKRQSPSRLLIKKKRSKRKRRK